jgi:hypothetical protein
MVSAPVDDERRRTRYSTGVDARDVDAHPPWRVAALAQSFAEALEIEVHSP